MWNVADPRSIEEYGAEISFLTACSLQKGQRILLICKYANESGIEQVAGSLIGQQGLLSLEEIDPQAISVFKKAPTEPVTQLQWEVTNIDKQRQ